MKISTCLTAALLALMAVGATGTSATEHILTLASGRANDALTILADGKVETKVELGCQTIYGIREKAIHVLSATKIDGKLKRTLQAIDCHTGKSLRQIDINVPYQAWLGGPDEQIVVGETGQYFLISVEDLGEAQGHRKNFSLAIVDGDTGAAELVPLPAGFNSPRLLKIPDGVAIYGWANSGLYYYNTSSKSLATVVPPGLEPEGKRYGMGAKSQSEVFRWNSKGQVEWFELKDGKLTPGKVLYLDASPSWVITSTFHGTPALICGIKSGKEEMVLLAHDAALDKELARVDAPLCASRAPRSLSSNANLLLNDFDGHVWRMSLSDLSVHELVKVPPEVAPYPPEIRVIQLSE
ncbi:hypothetical protein DES53_101284 [Roseimicrobium gellanilyticum]|uniref:Uncharacterized protein n=1 Tax=Roseimicrobium gellanilyticum TaxID=748857 RepID=A0A366HTS5_9BACT|nr:hypothetical protein [Roseimicrobium gellanilyticum]RBP47487.1 hypothetical protein DES53_101284 [Roseimicrobium gellanilyticum]